MALSNPQPANKLTGKRYRLVVENAEQAVHLIQKHLGTHAKVISVKQIKGKGISRFIKSTRLEVIAVVPKEEPEQTLIPERITANDATDQSETIEAPAKHHSTNSTASPNQSPEKNIDSTQQEVIPPSSNTELNTDKDDEPTHNLTYKFGYQTSRVDNRNSRETLNPVSKLLRTAKFDESLVSRFESSPQWSRISAMPIPHALGELYSLLSKEYHQIHHRESPLTSRVAFIGTPSVGKSTALCKQLANDMFLKNKHAKVLKLENDNPNPDDALRVFCDALNVPLLRYPIDIDQIEHEDTLYIDLPGCPINDASTWVNFSEQLDQLEVRSRVLVINAAYDADTIKSAYTLGHRHKATHVVFTHLDETTNPTKLWQFLLRGGLPTVFYSHGQNITSDYSEAILEFMMDKTFPQTIIP